MLRASICPIFAILCLINHIHCVDNKTNPEPEVLRASYRDSWLIRDWHVKGPNTEVRWQTSFVIPQRRFTYLTYEPSNNYCEIQQVATDSSEGDTLTCRHRFRRDETDIQMWGIRVHEKPANLNWISFEYTSASNRARNSWSETHVSLEKCKNRRSEPNAAAASPDNDNNTKTMEMTGDHAAPTLPKIKSEHLESKANGKEGTCDLNEARTQITCTQLDGNGKKIIDNVKFNLPTSWKAEWFRVYNTKSAAILLLFSNCPDGKCDNFNLVRLTANGIKGPHYVQPGMELRCSDVESSLTLELADVSESGQTCMHIVCLESDKDKDSKVKIGSLLQYRRLCITGDVVA